MDAWGASFGVHCPRPVGDVRVRGFGEGFSAVFGGLKMEPRGR